VNALDRMTVPSVKPSVINTANPGRRGTLRHANLGNNGFRQAAYPSTTATSAVNPSSPSSSASCETPNRLRTPQPLPARWATGEEEFRNAVAKGRVTRDKVQCDSVYERCSARCIQSRRADRTASTAMISPSRM
jgi:hypothetical protein